MKDKNDYYIGLMSGTSADGIDAALISLSADRESIAIIDTEFQAWASSIRSEILAFLHKDNNYLPDALSLDILIGEAFAECALTLIKRHPDKQIKAIGSHGQTLRHSPNTKPAYTLQVGNGGVISQRTNITTVNNFRTQDICLSGQGAPLAPLFHQAFFASEIDNRAIVNIGGISNISYVPAKNKAEDSANINLGLGFDSGPGNALMDAWTQENLGKAYDKDGAWASSGTVDKELLETLLKDSYINRKPPKSTGPEYFNLAWLKAILTENRPLTANDVQATLLQFTAESIIENINCFCSGTHAIYICGGGANNNTLMQAMKNTSRMSIKKTDVLGIDCDWVEACLFAWLAAKSVNNEKCDLRNITGSSKASIAGCVWPV